MDWSDATKAGNHARDQRRPTQESLATPANGAKGPEELLGHVLSDLTYRKDLLERAAVIADQVTHARSTVALGLSSGLGPFQGFR